MGPPVREIRPNSSYLQDSIRLRGYIQNVIERLRQLLWKTRGEERLFSTHRAPFQDPENAVGQTLPWRGRLYRVTRWEQVESVTLERGGTTKTWDIWGHPLTEKEIQAEVAGAAAAILADAAKHPQAGGDPDPEEAIKPVGDEEGSSGEGTPPGESPYSPA